MSIELSIKYSKIEFQNSYFPIKFLSLTQNLQVLDSAQQMKINIAYPTIIIKIKNRVCRYYTNMWLVTPIWLNPIPGTSVYVNLNIENILSIGITLKDATLLS